MDLSKITTYQAGIMQATMHRRLQRFSDDVLGSYGITKNHWLIIGAVKDHGSAGVRITELAELLGTNMSYMTNTINLLVSKNILLRDSHTNDNRSRMIKVHASFAPKCDEIEQALRAQLRNKVYSNVSQEDFIAYMKVISKLSEPDAK